MRFRIFIGICIAILSLMLLSCGGSEKRKMELFNKGMALYEKGKYAKAREEFKYVLVIDPKFAQGYYMLGMVEFRRKDWKRARGALSKAVELNPDLLDAEVVLGDVYVATKETVMAKEKAERVLAINPDHQGALLLKAACLVAEQKDNGISFKSML